MYYKFPISTYLARINDDFMSKTVTLKFYSGVVPTIEEAYTMSPALRDDELLGSTTIGLNSIGENTSQPSFLPTSDGEVSWCKIISGTYVICTDLIGITNEHNNIIWLHSKQFDTTISNTVQVVYLKMGVV
jgi:cystathionine beta-lyase family protein involved in aluminum resistance